MLKIPCMYYRGGTSKGPCFIREDLPAETTLRDEMLLRIMGSPNVRQIDGIGGGDSLSSKVAIVGISHREDVHLDYILCQVHVNQAIVETNLTCGNMLSAAVAFALERGLVKAVHPRTSIRIHDENTKQIMEVTVETPNAQVTYQGDASIDGVPGTSSPIKVSFLDCAGSSTGQLLPTGNIIDVIEGIQVTCIDFSVPMVILGAESMGKTGYESKDAFDDKAFMTRLENIRLKAGVLMGMGDVSKSVSPKICIVSSPRKGASIASRYFTPFDCHDAYAVSGAFCLAAACLIPGSVANQFAALKNADDNNHAVEIEHLSGKMLTEIKKENLSSGLDFSSASLIRTARPLFDGCVFLPTNNET